MIKLLNLESGTSGKKKSISNTVKNLFPQKLEQDLGIK